MCAMVLVGALTARAQLGTQYRAGEVSALMGLRVGGMGTQTSK